VASGGGGHGGGHGGGGGGGHKHHEEHEEHEEHVNHEAWVIPYADMLTLLMVMFLALFATGRVDIEKFKKLAANLRDEFGGSAQIVSVGTGGSGATPMQGGNGIFEGALPPKEGGEPTAMQVEKARQDYEKEAAADAVEKLQDFQDQLTSKSNIAGLGQGLDFTLEGRGLVVTVLSDAVLFGPGSANLESGGTTVLGIVAEALKMIPNAVVIEGHTDSRPISTSRFPSNWELSTARATAVLRYLAGTGIDPGRLSASGYGDTHPVGDNATAEGQAKNRRVEIIVLTDVSLEPILADAAGDTTGTAGGDGAVGETAAGAGSTGAPTPAVEP
jgi:chemotaxis protein MotB